MKDRLKELRKTLGLKQREVAERLGIDVGAVGNWEAGTRAIPKTRIYQLCKEYNVRREWLEHGTGEMFEPDDKLATIFTLLYDGLSPKYKLAFQKAAVELLDVDPRDLPKLQVNNGTVGGDMVQN